ncbi:hypothetical protein [Streptomyces sp. CBMA123]|uniref:hypothetical protein n=1 Tax=Streptomyces sp. CBMA123 TaxID=1896313 RepID=UPI001661FD59|nr:hypothetical protein [Streptomyces sp. CBMA123]
MAADRNAKGTRAQQAVFVGPHQLLRPLGEGGMGEVYLVSLGGELIGTRSSRLTPADLRQLVMRGARIGGAEPGLPSAAQAGPRQVIEVDRTVNRDGDIQLAGQRILLAAHLAGQQITLRFEGRVLHVIAGGYLVKTLACPIEEGQAIRHRRRPRGCGPVAPTATRAAASGQEGSEGRCHHGRQPVSTCRGLPRRQDRHHRHRGHCLPRP